MNMENEIIEMLGSLNYLRLNSNYVYENLCNENKNIESFIFKNIRDYCDSNIQILTNLKKEIKE